MAGDASRPAAKPCCGGKGAAAATVDAHAHAHGSSGRDVESPPSSHPQQQQQTRHASHKQQQRGSGSSSERHYHLVCLIGYSLSFIIFGSQVSILGPTIKPLAQQLGVDETDLSPLFTALGISCIVSGTPSGWVVDRFPTHYVLIGSLLVEAIGFSLVPYMPSVWSLTTLYFIICFSYNFTNSAVFTSLGWMFPKRAGGALNLVLAMFGVGSFCIPLAAELSRQYLGTALAVFWLVGALSVASTLPFLFVKSPAKPEPEAGGVVVIQHSSSKALELVTTIAVISLVFFTTAAETSIGNWLFTFSSKEMGLEDTDAALANSMFWGAFTLGRVVGVLVSPFTTPAILLLGSTPFCIAGAALPLLMQGHMTWHWVMATALLTGFGNSTGYANAVALLEQYVPVTGFINGVFGAVAGAACMVGPTLVAMLAKYTSLGYYAMAWVGLSFYLLHIPAITTAMLAGRRALALTTSATAAATAAAAGAAGEGQGVSAFANGTGEGLHEPLLSPHDNGHAAADPFTTTVTYIPGRTSNDSSQPLTIGRSYSNDISQPRTSLPGHFGSYGTSAKMGPSVLQSAASSNSPIP